MPDIFFDSEPKKEPVGIDQQPAHPAPKHVGPNEHALQSIEKLLKTSEQKLGILSAYSVHPKNISFVNQEPDEVILLFLRHHFITNVPWVLNTAFLIILPPIFFIITNLVPNMKFDIPQSLLFVLVAFYYLIVSSYAFGKFISWFYNIGIVTQKRIVDLDTSNILSHNTATATFNEIVEVKFIQRGFFQSFFDYGDIHIQTEAVHANFEFIASPKPTIVSDIISDLRVAQEHGGKHANS